MLILQRFMYRDYSKTSCLLGMAGSSSEVICVIASFSVKNTHIYVCVSTLPNIMSCLFIICGENVPVSVL